MTNVPCCLTTAIFGRVFSVLPRRAKCPKLWLLHAGVPRRRWTPIRWFAHLRCPGGKPGEVETPIQMLPEIQQISGRFWKVHIPIDLLSQVGIFGRSKYLTQQGVSEAYSFFGIFGGRGCSIWGERTDRFFSRSFLEKGEKGFLRERQVDF